MGAIPYRTPMLNISEYPIYFIGSWLPSDRENVELAVLALGEKLAEISGIRPELAFTCLFGYVEFVAGIPSANYDGYVSKHNCFRITLRPGKVRLSLVLHELGHLLTDNVPEQQSGNYLLARYGIKVGRRLVTGPGLNGYSRNAGYHAPRNGYIDDTFPAHEHPATDDGNNALEDFADILNSWVLNNIADNAAGQAIIAWITNYILERLKNCHEDQEHDGSARFL